MKSKRDFTKDVPAAMVYEVINLDSKVIGKFEDEPPCNGAYLKDHTRLKITADLIVPGEFKTTKINSRSFPGSGYITCTPLEQDEDGAEKTLAKIRIIDNVIVNAIGLRNACLKHLGIETVEIS